MGVGNTARDFGKKPRREQSRAMEHLRAIVEKLADGVAIVDDTGCILFVNPAAEELFGRSAEALTGSELGFPVVVGDSAEVDVFRPGGGTVTAELRAVEIEWDDAPALLVSLRDVTDRRRAEEQARQLTEERAARAEAEAANHAKSEFLAVMSHELRTPLNAVIGYSELLDLGLAGELTPDQRAQVARIRTSGQHLLGLVNEVLDLAKVEAGQLSVSAAPVRAATTADAALAIVQPRAEARGLRFSGRCAGGDVVYLGDEHRVRQILVNLLTNAVKFTPPGGTVSLECGAVEEPDANVRAPAGRRYVCFRVSDTGIGIPAEQQGAIFEMFTQVSTGHTRSNDGSGLGLTISRRLARLMGGDLTVQSAAAKGSTFTLWLPAAEAPVRADTPPATPGEGERLRGVGEVGELLLREVEPILEAFVSRLRAEGITPEVQSLQFSVLADHVATYVADLAAMLVVVEETRGRPSALLADGSEIQRLVAERHGAQRARLGWSVEALRIESALLRDEIERTIRRRGKGIPEAAVDEALLLLRRLLEQSEELAVRSWERARGA